jgi:hypothetical protein
VILAMTEAGARAGLADQHGCDGAGESQYQDTSGRDGDHVD